MPVAATVFLVDADVLIDYFKSELGILRLVAKHVGGVFVALPVLEEVNGLTPGKLRRLDVGVVEPDTEQMLQAGRMNSRVSYSDSLCLVICRDKSWTCVTNDRALQKLCRSSKVKTRYGLGLMVDLVTAGVLTRQHALRVARKIQASNPHHINESVLARFQAALVSR